MKYWFGYLTAGIFAAMTWVLTQFGERYATLVDMIYPYVIRELQDILANWTSQISYPIWQVLAVVLAVLILASIVLMIVLKWNPIQWAGWVLAVFAGIYLLHMAMWGMNYYAGSLADDLRLEVSTYNLEELTEATEYYRDKANALAEKVSRDSAGNVEFASFEELADHVTITPDDYVVIMTRGHQADYEVLPQTLRCGAKYVGCIGSKKKLALCRDRLLEVGFTAEEYARVHAPIGLSIGAETPAEIAVSITAELSAVRAGRLA